MHCSASREGQRLTAADIDRMHKQRGFAKIGYHYVVQLDGTVEVGRKESEVGAHAQGHNSDSIGICYIGGVAADGKTPKDTRTESQRVALRQTIGRLRSRYPGAIVLGHRDLSPDKDGDGKVEPHEWMKACPSFDVRTQL